jgi:hypothetical protein
MFESPRVELNLYLNDPQLAAMQIEEFLRGQSPEVRKYLQSRIDDIPLTITPKSEIEIALSNLEDLSGD